jgi:microcystin-dependent protein
MDAFLGQIIAIPWEWEPMGWMFCRGQRLSIPQYSALYSLIGVNYGGDGVNYFNLPDLQGRTPIGTGTGPGGPAYVIGEAGGLDSVTLASADMPNHAHMVAAVNTAADKKGPKGNFLADSSAAVYTSAEVPDLPLAGSACSTSAGSGAAHNNVQPSLGLNWIICVEDGVFPQRP